MKYLKKFESSESHMGLIKDTFLDLVEEFNLNFVVRKVIPIDVMVYGAISKLSNSHMTLDFVKSVINGDDNHHKFKHHRDYNTDISLIKKYDNYKYYMVTIDSSDTRRGWRILGKKLVHEIDRYSKLIESYGFTRVYNNIPRFGPAKLAFVYK